MLQLQAYSLNTPSLILHFIKALVKMKAIAVSDYGSIDNLISIETDNPKDPEGYDVLVQSVQCPSLSFDFN